jgi:hypothetical protein
LGEAQKERKKKEYERESKGDMGTFKPKQYRENKIVCKGKKKKKGRPGRLAIVKESEKGDVRSVTLRVSKRKKNRNF